MTDFRQFSDGFPQNRWLIFPKSVADFPKIGDRFSSKSVTDFPKVGGSFSESRWLISPKSVTDFLKVGDGFPKVGHGFPQKWRIFLKTEPGFIHIVFLHNRGRFPNFHGEVMLLTNQTVLIMVFPPLALSPTTLNPILNRSTSSCSRQDNMTFCVFCFRGCECACSLSCLLRFD